VSGAGGLNDTPNPIWMSKRPRKKLPDFIAETRKAWTGEGPVRFTFMEKFIGDYHLNLVAVTDSMRIDQNGVQTGHISPAAFPVMTIMLLPSTLLSGSTQ